MTQFSPPLVTWERRLVDTGIADCPMSWRNVVAACLFSAALSMATASFGLRAADLTVKVAVGERNIVELIENPSTGYRWAIDTKASSRLSILRIKDLGFSRKVGNSLFPNGPGYHRWTIEAATEGTARITFVEQGPPAPGPIHAHQVIIKATSR